MTTSHKLAETLLLKEKKEGNTGNYLIIVRTVEAVSTLVQQEIGSKNLLLLRRHKRNKIA